MIRKEPNTLYSRKNTTRMYEALAADDNAALIKPQKSYQNQIAVQRDCLRSETMGNFAEKFQNFAEIFEEKGGNLQAHSE